MLVELFNSALTGKLCVKVEDLYSVFRKNFLNFKWNKIYPPYSVYFKKVYSTDYFTWKFTIDRLRRTYSCEKERERQQNSIPILWCIDKI